MAPSNFFEQLFNDQVDVTKLKVKRRGISNVRWEDFKSDICKRIDVTHDWAGLNTKHFVALYAVLHERVYKVSPIELNERGRIIVLAMSKTMFTRQFDCDSLKMSSFFLWVWNREYRLEQWREKKGIQGRRISYGYQFSNYLLTEWRINGHRDFAEVKRAAL